MQRLLRHTLRRTGRALAIACATVVGLTSSVCIAADGANAQTTPSDRVDAIVRHAMDDRGIPGLQVAVVLDGKIVFSRSYGVANLQTPVPVTPSTLFTLNSITKAFTGVAVMEEVEKGRLDLAAPISRYLDDIPQSWGRVTVAQLMGQVSGLPDVFAYGDYELTGITDEAKAWAWVVNQPVSPPGEKREYCQTNLALVQRILNKLNGRAANDSVIGEELARAGMTQTRFGDSRDVMKAKSQPYRRLNAEGELRNHFEQFPPTMHGNSGLNSTAEDMARWMISVLDGRQLSEKSLQTLWAPVLMNNGRPSSFSIGWGPEQRANYSSVGMSGGARSAFSVYPRYGAGVVILTNLLGAAPEELTDEVAAAFVPDLRLSGVYKLRAEAEQARFENLDALLAAAQAQKPSGEFKQGELEDWISRLSYGGSLSRALRLAKFDVALFPGDGRALEVLAKAYLANGFSDEAKVTYRQILTRDPQNKAARAYLEKT